MVKTISLLFGGAVHIGIIGSHVAVTNHSIQIKVENRGEVLPSSLKLLVMVVKAASANILDRRTETFATTNLSTAMVNFFLVWWYRSSKATY